jgi:DNA adenine methylase
MDSFLSYVGGKSLLCDKIIPLIPQHKCYVEVFAGAAWLLFRKPPSRIEILNDINGDLTTLYRCVKNHLDELVRYMRWLLVSRDEWERFRKEDPSTLTDIQRSARFFFLLKNSFSSKLDFSSFRVSSTGLPTFNLLRIEEVLSEAHTRLARTYIENRPFQNIVQRFDRCETFFYLDPPYYGCENYYGRGIFAREDFDELNGILRKIKGKFILSINDHPEIRRIFDGFKVESVSTKYSVGNNNNQTVKELLIRNFEG